MNHWLSTGPIPSRTWRGWLKTEPLGNVRNQPALTCASSITARSDSSHSSASSMLWSTFRREGWEGEGGGQGSSRFEDFADALHRRPASSPHCPTLPPPAPDLLRCCPKSTAYEGIHPGFHPPTRSTLDPINRKNHRWGGGCRSQIPHRFTSPLRLSSRQFAAEVASQVQPFAVAPSQLLASHCQSSVA